MYEPIGFQHALYAAVICCPVLLLRLFCLLCCTLFTQFIIRPFIVRQLCSCSYTVLVVWNKHNWFDFSVVSTFIWWSKWSYCSSDYLTSSAFLSYSTWRIVSFLTHRYSHTLDLVRTITNYIIPPVLRFHPRFNAEWHKMWTRCGKGRSKGEF